MEPHAGNSLMRPGNVRKAAPWVLAALGAMATAIILTLASAGTAQALYHDFAATSWNNTITLHWNSQAGESYAYYIQKDGASQWTGLFLDDIPVERHSHTITGLDYGVKYKVFLNACPGGNRNNCGQVTHILRVRTAPAAPENLQYTLTAEYDVVLTWDDPKDPSINEYRYRVTPRGEDPDSIDWVVAAEGRITTYTIPADELTQGDNEIELAARSDAGGSAATVTVSVPDLGDVPDPGRARELPTPGPLEPTPTPQQPTPGPQQPTPAPQQPTPVPQQPTPAPQQPTPAPQQPTPAPQEPTPAPQEPTPAPQQPTPTPSEDN